MEEMSKEIMWVNDREEEELVFDWGDKNIDQYIPLKQESYSVSGTFLPDALRLMSVMFKLCFLLLEQKLMSDLELKEKDLNKLKAKADALLKSNHPASDKIEVGEPEQVVSSILTGSFERDWCFIPALPGLQGHSADSVELAAADHQVHRHPPERERSLQPGNRKPAPWGQF